MFQFGDMVCLKHDESNRQYYIRWIYQNVAFLVPEEGSMDDEVEVPLIELELI